MYVDLYTYINAIKFSSIMPFENKFTENSVKDEIRFKLTLDLYIVQFLVSPNTFTKTSNAEMS